MAVFFPDTSTLMSLFDETEPLHDRAREILRQYKIKEVFVPMTVQTEWQSRAQREHKRLVTNTIRQMDLKRGKGVTELTVSEFNILIDTAATEIRGKPTIEGRKLDQARKNLQREIASTFRTSAGITVTKRPIEDVKEYIIRLNYAFFEKSVGVIGFFIQHGYSHPDIKEEVENAVKKYISEHKIELETQDAMILGDMLRYAVADSEEYDFVVGDKAFYKKSQEYISSYDGVNSRVNFKLLSSN